MNNTSATSIAAIERVVGRLRWRLRAQAALRHGLLLGAIGLFVFAACVVFVKLRVLPTDWVWVGGTIAIVLPLVGIGLGVFQRLGDIALAASLDAAGGLHSRLGSALAFARLPERTAMQEAAVSDALQVISQARPAGAAPWRWGVFAAGAIALAVAIAVTGPAVFVFELRVAHTTGSSLAKIVVPPRVQLEKAEVRKEDKQRLEELSNDIDEEARTATDPTVLGFLDDLNELIRALQEGRITPEEAAARMAALEKALAEWKEEHQRGAEDVEKRLQEAAEKQKKTHDALKPLLDAMRERDWNEAANELDELAKKLANKTNKDEKELSDKDKQKIAKDLEQLAKALENERQKDKERLQKERDRLKEKEQREKDRFAKKDKDRLRDTERQLEQLDDPSQQEAQSEPERQLERLSDELDDAARDMLRRLAEEAAKAGQQGEQGPESEQRRDQGQQGEQGEGQGMTAEDIQRAADALRRMAQNGKGRQQMRVAQGRMVDVREMMRRGQNGKQGQGGEGQGGEAGEQAGGSAEQQFEEGAQGDGKEPMIGMGDKPGGKPGDMLLLGGPNGGKGMKIPGLGKGQGDSPEVGQGEGIGEGHDKDLFGGEKPSMDFKTKEDFVEGQHGEGQSKEKVVMSAAQKGFASRAYREVHQDYAGVVEDALEKEHIPPGKRTYVRRYFDLIRPR